LSEAAVARAGADAGPNAAFVAADAERYQPEGVFDFVVFNEVVYYFHEPISEVERYARALSPNGRVVVSTWQGSPRGRAVLRSLRQAFDVEGETIVTQGRNSWALTVLRPPDRR